MLIAPENPVELAAPYTHVSVLEPDFDHSDAYKETLIDLVTMAGVSQFFTKWRFEATLGFVVPKVIQNDKKESVTYTRFDNGLYCEGDFYSYSALSIGRIIGAGSVRSLCLTFDSGFFASPQFCALETGDYLHVPVESVVDIEKVDSST